MNKIKNFFQRNKLISILAIVALGISIFYMITYRMPDYFGIEPFYLWLNDLSIGYIAAFIFYIVQVYLKGENDKNKFLEATKNSYANLIKYMDVALLVCDQHIKFKDKGADLIWNGEAGEEKIYISYSSNTNKSIHCKSYTKQEILQLPQTFKLKIQEIKDSPIVSYCDFELLEVLTEVEQKNLFKNIKQVISYADTEIDLHMYRESFDEALNLSRRLKELCGLHDEYHLNPVDYLTKVFADLAHTDIADDLRNLDELKNKIKIASLQRRLAEEQGINLSIEDTEKLLEKYM